MLQEIITDFIQKGNTIITSSPGNGCTALTIHLLNLLLHKNDVKIVYYNSTADIDINFVKQNKHIQNDIFFHQGTLPQLISFLEYINYDIDFLVVDPGDTLMIDKNLFCLLKKLCKGKILATSQIRQNLNKGGQVYSTLESTHLFDYSIWIRDVSEGENLFKARYLDIYDQRRNGNNYLRRYVVKFDNKTGNVMEV